MAVVEVGKTVGEGVPPGAQVDMGGGELDGEPVGELDGLVTAAAEHPASIKTAINITPGKKTIFFKPPLSKLLFCI